MKPSYSWGLFLLAAVGLFCFNYLEFRQGRWLSLVIPAGMLMANYVGITQLPDGV